MSPFFEQGTVLSLLKLALCYHGPSSMFIRIFGFTGLSASGYVGLIHYD